MKIKFLLATIALASVFCISTTALAMTDAEKQALIASIQTQIAQLTAQLNQMLSEQSWCYTFNNNLGYAQSNTTDVTNLHIALQKEGISYSPDDINTYSTGTAAAVTQFQAKYGISPQSGYVGNLTRAKLNQIYGCTTTTPTICTPNWSCGSWGDCSNGQQTKSCYDLNYCGVTTNKPAITQSCTNVCSPNWQTGTWGTCTNNQQTRTVTDTNYCGVTTNAPATTQYCNSTTTCTPNWNCSGFGDCINGIQTQICTDSNYCGTTTNEPPLTQSCNSSVSNSACTDTDGSQKTSGNVSSTMPGVTYSKWGENYYTKGTTTGVYNSWNSANSKSGIYGPYTDYCSGNNLIEYYCYTASSSTDQVVATYSDAALAGYANGGAPAAAYYSKQCDLGCQNGACKTGIFVNSPLNSQAPPFINIILGKTYSIRWSFEGIPSASVNINLVDDSTSKVYSIATNLPTPANGSGYSWNVSKSIPAGTKYKISVEAGAVKGVSTYFSIVSNIVCYNSCGVQVQGPNVGSTSCSIAAGDSNLGVSYYQDSDTCSYGGFHPSATPFGQSTTYYIKTSTKYSCSLSGSLITTTASFNCPYAGCSYGCVPICTPNWKCSGFGTCVNGWQTQTCTDSNQCGTTMMGTPPIFMPTEVKPATAQECIGGCTTNWQCGAWSTCTGNYGALSNGTTYGDQLRTCTDSNNCGYITDKPAIKQYCTTACTPNWSCGSWSLCTNNKQIRTCTDLNSCGFGAPTDITTRYGCPPILK